MPFPIRIERRRQRWLPVAVLALGLAIGARVFFTAPPASGFQEVGIPEGIAWYGVLEEGLAEAKRTNRPILLLSAAPQCAGVSGMW